MMVRVMIMYKAVLRMVMKMVGMRPQKVEIEKGTVINFWVPSKPQDNKKLAVVLLHGFAGDGILTWQFQVPALARKYAVYVPDLVFFGGSTTERGERTVEFQAECVAEGLKKLGVEKWCAVGFSYGGFVGFKMAEMYGEKVEAVVVTGSIPELVESLTRRLLHQIGGFSSLSQFLLPAKVDGVRLLLDLGFYKRIPCPTFLLRDFFKEAISVNRKKKEELLGAFVKNIESPIPNYPQEIHMIWGANDKVIGLEVAKNLKTEIGEKAEVHGIEKAGHLVMLERPFAYNALLSNILAHLTSSHQHSTSSSSIV